MHSSVPVPRQHRMRWGMHPLAASIAWNTLSRVRPYDYLESDQTYKLRLLMHLLGTFFRRIAVDLLMGDRHRRRAVEE